MTPLSSYLPSAVALLLLSVASLILTVSRPRLRAELVRNTRFFTVVGCTILAQTLHFVEEWRSNFFIRLPAVFGLSPFEKSAFVWLNVTCLGIWIVALFAVRAGRVVALWPLWLLGLAAVLNLVAHSMLAMRTGGYFPGLLTTPLVGILGVLMIRELLRVTADESAN